MGPHNLCSAWSGLICIQNSLQVYESCTCIRLWAQIHWSDGSLRMSKAIPGQSVWGSSIKSGANEQILMPPLKAFTSILSKKGTRNSVPFAIFFAVVEDVRKDTCYIHTISDWDMLPAIITTSATCSVKAQGPQRDSCRRSASQPRGQHENLFGSKLSLGMTLLMNDYQMPSKRNRKTGNSLKGWGTFMLKTLVLTFS